jgi:hypothetical protein
LISTAWDNYINTTNSILICPIYRRGFVIHVQGARDFVFYLIFFTSVLTSGCLSGSSGISLPAIVEKGDWGTVENTSIKVMSVNAPLNKNNFPVFKKIHVIIINNRTQEITIRSEKFALTDVSNGIGESPDTFNAVAIESEGSKEFDLKFDPDTQHFHNYPYFYFCPDGSGFRPECIVMKV